MISAASEVVERSGLDQLTMRNVAVELSCGTMSLYSHVHSREDLIDGLVESLISELDTESVAGESWQESARRVLDSYRSLAQRRPRTFELLALASDDAPPVCEHLMQLLGVLQGCGLSLDDAQRLLVLLDSFGTGFLMVATRTYVDRSAAPRRPRWSELEPLRRVEMFEASVDALLAGFEASLA